MTKVALIGPGIMSIPTVGWGAVENLIWNYKTHLEALGHSADIYNTRDLRSVTNAINEIDYDFIHLHYDQYVEFFNVFLKKPYCCTTHYGYILKPHLWERGYDRIYKDTLRAPGIIALSGEIAATYRSSGYEGFLRVIRNGADVPSFKFTREGNQKAICLGKIEPRKQQALLAQLLEGQSQIDFVGPLVDREFKENRTCRYLGVWDKPYLLEHLTDYNCLVLFSVGEASPLVVPEALAAGLSLVISESASANLDAKEFITVLPDKVAEPKTIRDAINSQIQSNSGFRQQIREYALARFSWAVIMREYEVLTREFIELRPKAARKTRMESVDWNLRRLRTKLMSWHRR